MPIEQRKKTEWSQFQADLYGLQKQNNIVIDCIYDTECFFTLCLRLNGKILSTPTNHKQKIKKKFLLLYIILIGAYKITRLKKWKHEHHLLCLDSLILVKRQILCWLFSTKLLWTFLKLNLRVKWSKIKFVENVALRVKYYKSSVNFQT